MPNILEKIFSKNPSKKSTGSDAVHTTPLTEDQLQATIPLQKITKPAQYTISCGQSVGLQRDHNEDTLFTLSSVIADGHGDKPFGLAIIADGMGGHRNGEIASSVSTRAVAKYVLNKVFSHFLDPQDNPVNESLQEILEDSVKEAQKAVVHYAPGGGTTLTIALILGEHVTIGHVGDSRAYFIYPDGRLQKITKDHSLVQRMVDLEEITEAEAATHPQKNVLLKAVGQPEPFRPDIQTHQLPHGGKLILCSDGLWSVVNDLEIFRIFTASMEPIEICNKLVEAANEAGGPDNISVVLVDFSRI